MKDLHNKLYLTFITSIGELTKVDQGDLISVRVDNLVDFFYFLLLL